MAKVLLVALVATVVAIGSFAEGREPPRVTFFGAKTFVLSVEKFTTWTDVLKRHRSQRKSKEWRGLLAKLRDVPHEKLLEEVNRIVNSTPAVSDPNSGGVWITPTEFLQSGGDCEEFATTKYLALRALGVPSTKMHILFLAARPGLEAHAILVVSTSEGPIVLDNLSTVAYPLSREVSSRLKNAFNEKTWLLRVYSDGLKTQ